MALDRPEELADLRNTVLPEHRHHHHNCYCCHYHYHYHLPPPPHHHHHHLIYPHCIISFDGQVHYMYFALGAYGWPMYLLQNKTVSVIQSFLCDDDDDLQHARDDYSDDEMI